MTSKMANKTVPTGECPQCGRETFYSDPCRNCYDRLEESRKVWVIFADSCVRAVPGITTAEVGEYADGLHREYLFRFPLPERHVNKEDQQ